MNSVEKVSNEVRVKDEPICYSQSISETKSKDISEDDELRQSIKVKEEPIDIEVELKAEVEEKFSSREEFTNKTSIAFLNEQTTNNQAY